MNVVVLNLGVANYGSILNMLKKLGVNPVLTIDVEIIADASHIILPGVGAFDSVMEALNDHPEIIEVLENKVLNGHTPFLGICVGMQLLFESSEEGNLRGLNWLPGKFEKFNFIGNAKLSVPHMGWNLVNACKTSSILNKAEDYKFYFVHSFRLVETDSDIVMSTTNYGGDFISSVVKGNIYGCQFHPEKSHRYGKIFFERFLELR